MHKKTFKLLLLILYITALQHKDANAQGKTPTPDNDNSAIFISPLTGLKTGAPLLIMNKKGDTLKMKKFDVMATNFARWKYDGKTRYSYFLEDTTFYKMKGVNYYTGYQVIADTSFNEIKRVKLLSHGNINADLQPGLDNHEFILLADNHYITLAYYEIIPGNIPDSIPHVSGMKIITPVIQEVYKNKVRWQWVGTDHPELFASSYFANDSTMKTLTTDYLHVNSMYVDPADGNLIVSCRNSDQVLKLNRTNNKIAWKLGGHNSDFAIPAKMRCMRQHHVTKSDSNKLLLVDNGDKIKRNYSRVLEYTIDEENKVITAIQPTLVNKRLIEFGGSVQKINGSYFVNGGSAAFLAEVESKKGYRTFHRALRGGAYRALRYID